MDKETALQLIDAHLDEQSLTPEQAREVAEWLRESPEHADEVYHRIFLHSILHRKLAAGNLPEQIPPLPGIIDQISPYPSSRSSGMILCKSPPVKQSSRMIWLLMGACGALVLMLALSWKGARPLVSPPLPVEQYAAQVMARQQPPLVYEGFDYPPTPDRQARHSDQNWPTQGGLSGLQGGWGWATPWEEQGSKVAVIESDPQQTLPSSADMRKFGLLGYADSEGRILESTGWQLRTSDGPFSSTHRLLEVTRFPAKAQAAGELGADGFVLWLSFLAQSFDSRGDRSRYAYLQLGSDEAGFRLGKLSSSASGNWSAAGVLQNTEVNLKTSPILSGEVAFFVVRITFRPGAEQSDIWINPPLEHPPETSTASLQLTLPDFRFHELSIVSSYSTDFDEIRLGTTFRSVTPLR